MQIVQLPLNVVEGGAVLGRGGIVPEAKEGDCYVAQRLQVGVFGNRPLHAIPVPGMSSGDWGRSGASHINLRDAKPMGTVEALLKRTILDQIGDEALSANPSFQQVALHLGASAPGVSCMLNGMKKENYVKDAAAVLAAKPLSEEVVVKALATVRTAALELGGSNRGLW